MTKSKKVYVAKSTGKRWNTKEEAAKDNARYKNDVAYRMAVKSENYGVVNPTISYPIPFIKSKKRTLTNAGLSTGAVISENMLDSIDSEFDSHVKNLLKIILYSLYSPSEFFAIQIHNSVVGYGTADDQLIRCIISRADVDMKKIKKYYKKIYNKDMIDEVNNDLSGSYKTIIEGLIKK